MKSTVSRNKTTLVNVVSALSRRLTMHHYDGAPFELTKGVHGTYLTRDVNVSYNNFVKTETDQLRLPKLEVTLIQTIKPRINNQPTCTPEVMSPTEFA